MTDRTEELKKELKELDDKDLSASTHAFCVRAELKGRQEALAEFEKKYPNFRSIYDDAFMEGAMKMRDEIREWIFPKEHLFNVGDGNTYPSIRYSREEFDAKFGDKK